ncbi:Cytosolic sulfotransferase 15 [Bienertia sinuspersici]
MGSNLELVKYQNFWCRSFRLKDVIHCQKHFIAQDTDIFIASIPKTGATWLKALLFTIINRHNPDHQPLNKNSPLLNHNPHELVYFLDHGIYGGKPPLPSPQELQQLPSPRLLQTHVPYASYPESIRTSSCKIVYIARNPLDTLVALWHWHLKIIKNWVGDLDEFQPPSIEDFFKEFCLGRFPSGPYFDHVTEFFKQSLQQPNKVMFLKYEDLKGDHVVSHVKKMAEFVGFPFSDHEEDEGVINDIIELCSFNNLKELEINKTGMMRKLIDNKNFFRKGEVGDWANHLTPSMVEEINILMQEKFGDIGLSFQV